MVVGAYPGGRSPDMCRPGGQECERAWRNVATVALPARDPVYGKPGPAAGALANRAVIRS